MFRLSVLLGLILALFMPAACSPGFANRLADSGPGQERVLLWHTWDTAQAAALDAMLTAYQNLNPNVEVIAQAIPEESLINRLESRSRAGLGPDIVLADAAQVYAMAEAGLIRDLAPLELDLSTYLSPAIQMVSDTTRLYALPMAAHIQVLYFNRTLVDVPPATISELVQRIEEGESLAQSPHFIASYWGVGAYDGGFADSQRRLLFGQGGFANWLDFLTAARTLPGFLLEDNPQALQQAFIDGEVTYYIGDSIELVDLTAAMGPDAVGVALLPTGPNGGAPSPFLALDALAFTNVSNDREFAQALSLAQFLTDAQNQQSLTMADLGLAPTNNRVRLTPSLPLNSLTVARQSRTAEIVPFVNRALWNDLNAGALGFFDAYQQVIQGVLPLDTMVDLSLQRFEEEYGLLPQVTAAEELCPTQPASVNLWHSLRFGEAQTLEQLARDFEETCAGMTLQLSYVDGEQIVARFQEAYDSAADDAADPDMLLLSSRWLAPLAEAGLLLDLTERVAAGSLQQFLPETVETMRYGGRLYGIPESLEVLALFHNLDYIADPPIDMEQLVLTVDSQTRLALPVGFFWGYWGMDPFGGFEFDSYTGRILQVDGLTAWLARLQFRDPEAGIDLYFDHRAAEDAFAFEEAVYLVSGPWSLPRLRQEVGDDRFRVAPLPNGPVMAGRPMLQVTGTVVSIDADELAADTAVAFSRFLNLPASQQQLAATGSHVSASVTVDLSAYPNIEGFREQAKSAALVVENSNFARLEAQGDLLYEAVLVDGADPQIAVPAFVEAVHRENGVAASGE